MRSWRWIISRFRRGAPTPIVPPVTPPEEHAAAQRRVHDLEHEVDRLQRLIGEHQDLPRRLGGLR